MIRLALLILLLLAACATPSADYFGVPARSVVIDGREYRLFVRQAGPTARVQVIRMGWAGGRDHAPILAAMVQAAEQSTGCTALPSGYHGDSGVLNLTLRCAD